MINTTVTMMMMTLYRCNDVNDDNDNDDDDDDDDDNEDIAGAGLTGCPENASFPMTETPPPGKRFPISPIY